MISSASGPISSKGCAAAQNPIGRPSTKLATNSGDRALALHVIGIRHHSPACAQLVEETLRQVRPTHVLIEGPADMNERLDELHLPHRLPIAIFSYYRGSQDSSACWAPFCDYSPEWRALIVGREIGAQVRFMDLPGWSKDFRGQRNRFADRFRSDFIDELCRRFHMDGLNALWDHLFELPLTQAELRQRLQEYFDKLRPPDLEDPHEQSRESFMSSCIAWAMAQGGEVVAVCGGYHKPQLERSWQGYPPHWPALPTVDDEARWGSYLVPYSFKRLDSFVGYEAGMPSPGYYQEVWDKGVERASEELLRLAATRLRERHQQVSAADLVAAMTMARGLMGLRGHQVMARCDVLDGLAAALLKEPQEAPPPWTVAGPLTPGSDPVVVEIVAALSGDRQGRLAQGTPRPPLLGDVQELLKQHGLVPPQSLNLSLEQPQDRPKSQVLHRLAVLAIDGFQRTRGPLWATETDLRESWKIQELPTTETTLIEAATWGGTLEGAASAFLEDQLLQAGGDTRALAEILGQAVLAGMPHLGNRLIQTLAAQVAQESDFARLGGALGRLLDLWRYHKVVEMAQTLETLLADLVDRGLWLVENLQGTSSPQDQELVAAVVAIRDTLLHAGLDQAAPAQVMERKSQDHQAPPAVQGAALGFLWSLGKMSPDRAVQAVAHAARPETLGDFLAGLFALAREQVTGSPEVVAVIDQVLSNLDSPDFLVALPSLRLAFSYFPPREKDRLARTILTLHGNDPDQARQLTRRLPVSPEVVARGLRLDSDVEEVMRRYGLVR